MEYITVDLENRYGSEFPISKVKETIIDAGKNGFLFKGFVPQFIAKNGRIATIDLVFDVMTEKVDYEIVTKYNTSKLTKEIYFDNMPQLIDRYEDDGMSYCGFVPTVIDKNGAIVEMDLVFTRK